MPKPASASPCTGLCRLDDKTGWCLGCGRTPGEIGEWPSASEDRRQAIKRELPKRLQSLRRRPG